ncbi:unnamed protein product [Adineta steineri]|uniref:Uncharacterized protein n=1 Tax=Adineta steineri TaxID=433720 RepID=A0A814JX27_9BILA|nr:unnamed protein product [Adineta steineri]CAF1318876.1 unnamed protein product [Adineta steineri]
MMINVKCYMKDLIHSYVILKTRLEHLIDQTKSNSNANSGTSTNESEIMIPSMSTYISTLLLSAGLKKQFQLAISQLALLGELSVKQIVESVSL